MGNDCIFCKIRDGDIPGEFLYRDNHCFVIRDIAPQAPVHLLVIPNAHFTFLSNLTSEKHDMIGAMFSAAKEVAAGEKVDISGYRPNRRSSPSSPSRRTSLRKHVLMAGKPGLPSGISAQLKQIGSGRRIR